MRKLSREELVNCEASWVHFSRLIAIFELQITHLLFLCGFGLDSLEVLS